MHNTLPCSSTGLTHGSMVFDLPYFQKARSFWFICVSGYRPRNLTIRTPTPSYQSDQRVWLSTENLLLRVRSPKLAHCFVGPFQVSEVINPVAMRLKLLRSMRVHPTFHVSQLKPPWSRPTTPQFIVGDPIYTIKKLMTVHHRGRGFQYLVDWESYGSEDGLRSLRAIPVFSVYERLFIDHPFAYRFGNHCLRFIDFLCTDHLPELNFTGLFTCL